MCHFTVCVCEDDFPNEQSLLCVLPIGWTYDVYIYMSKHIYGKHIIIIRKHDWNISFTTLPHLPSGKGIAI